MQITPFYIQIGRQNQSGRVFFCRFVMKTNYIRKLKDQSEINQFFKHSLKESNRQISTFSLFLFTNSTLLVMVTRTCHCSFKYEIIRNSFFRLS